MIFGAAFLVRLSRSILLLILPVPGTSMFAAINRRSQFNGIRGAVLDCPQSRVNTVRERMRSTPRPRRLKVEWRSFWTSRPPQLLGKLRRQPSALKCLLVRRPWPWPVEPVASDVSQLWPPRSVLVLVRSGRGQVETETDDRVSRSECLYRGVVSFGFDLTPSANTNFSARWKRIKCLRVDRDLKSSSPMHVHQDVSNQYQREHHDDDDRDRDRLR